MRTDQNSRIVKALAPALVLVTVLVTGAGSFSPAIAGAPWDKATGDIVVTNVNFPARRHWFSFAAHEKGVEPGGKGFIAHERLNSEGTEVLREEYSVVLYVIVDGNEAWFAGPIVYDSEDPNPDRWFALHVYNGGQPRDNDDWMWFTRAANESEALAIVENMTSPGTTHVVRSGNLKVHSY
jgi:hypothetical protein